MHGKIVDFSEKQNAVIIETGAGKITFDRSSISMEMSRKLNEPAEGNEIGSFSGSNKKPLAVNEGLFI